MPEAEALSPMATASLTCQAPQGPLCQPQRCPRRLGRAPAGHGTRGLGLAGEGAGTIRSGRVGADLGHSIMSSCVAMG